MCLPLLELQGQTVAADVSPGSTSDWQSHLNDFDDTFPNCVGIFLSSYRSLSHDFTKDKLDDLVIHPNNASLQLKSAMVHFSRTYFALIQADLTLSDSQLRQDSLLMKLGNTNRESVRELIATGRKLGDELHLSETDLRAFAQFSEYPFSFSCLRGK